MTSNNLNVLNLKYDNKSHGSPHATNSALFWETKKEFAEKYDTSFDNFGGEAPETDVLMQEEFKHNLEVVIGVLKKDQVLVDYLVKTHR